MAKLRWYITNPIRKIKHDSGSLPGDAPVGSSGFFVERSAALGDTLEEAFRAEGPSLVAIPIDYRENALLTQRLGNIKCPI